MTPSPTAGTVRAAALGLLALLAACSGEDGAPDNVATETIDLAPASTHIETAAVAATPSARPASFAVCTVCHTAGKDEPNRLGPNLFGSYGAKAAYHPGFNYSPALKGSGLVWTDENLHKWLERPAALVPGNRMAFAGIKDAAKRQEIIDYLKAQR